jgi:hypothetical protein
MDDGDSAVTARTNGLQTFLTLLFRLCYKFTLCFSKKGSANDFRIWPRVLLRILFYPVLPAAGKLISHYS